MGVPIQFQKNHATNTFKERPHEAGRPRGSFKSIIEDLVKKEGLFRVPKKDCVITEDEVLFKIPDREKLMLRMLSLANSKNQNTAMKAIDWLVNRVDGKPKEHIEVKQKEKLQKITFEIIDSKDQVDEV